ncbi:MAG: histidine phosphatase family protein [Nanoarchaeota archaeon]
MNVIVMRHGQTNYNVKGLCSETEGEHVHLTEKGKLQAKLVARRMKSESFDCIITSKLYRTIQTASYINEFHDAPQIIDERINDRYTGCDSRPIEEFRTLVKHDPYNARPPGGESLVDVKERIDDFIRWLSSQPYDTVLIITHAVIVKMIIIALTGKPLTHIKELRIDPASYEKLHLSC